MSAQPLVAQAARMMREAADRLTWLYAIQAGDDGPIKIGVTNSPSARLATLQQGNAEELHGLAAWRGLVLEEKQLHAEFDHVRIRGEWFRPAPELVEFVCALGGDFEDWEP
jgi:antitoxin (DNA-binding transcriptional repressor) of toxin-antitoxin stability system